MNKPLHGSSWGKQSPPAVSQSVSQGPAWPEWHCQHPGYKHKKILQKSTARVKRCNKKIKWERNEKRLTTDEKEPCTSISRRATKGQWELKEIHFLLHFEEKMTNDWCKWEMEIEDIQLWKQTGYSQPLPSGESPPAVWREREKQAKKEKEKRGKLKHNCVGEHGFFSRDQLLQR